MKRNFFWLLVWLLAHSLNSCSQDPDFHIYLCFGQSNMEGTGTIESQDRITNSRVRMLQDQTCSNLNRTYGTWYTALPPLNRCWGGLSPADNFGRIMAANMPSNITIGLVNTSVGGCDIAFFQKSAPLGKAATKGGQPADIPAQFNGGYAWMLDLARKAKTAGVIKGIIFHQGETNTNDPNWKLKVQEIVNNLRTDLAIGNVPFLAGELLYSQYNSCCSSHNSEIAKLPGIIPNSYVISASGLPGKDVAHFTSASYRELGKRYADKMLTLVKTACAPTLVNPSVQINGGSSQSVTSVSANEGAKITLSPTPASGGSWLWTGCGLSGTNRQQTVTPASSCTATVNYTNTCGAKSTLDFKITISGVKKCCGSKSSSNFSYCCTLSDPDGDGWGWENGASCIVPGSAADPDKCSTVVTSLTENSDMDVHLNIHPNPFSNVLQLKVNGSFTYVISDLLQNVLESGNAASEKEVGAGLKNGLYILHIRNENSVHSIKIAKE